MKQEETTQALQQNFFQEKSKFEIVEEKLKNTIFGVLNILLKFDDDSFYGEVLSLYSPEFITTTLIQYIIILNSRLVIRFDLPA